MRSFGSSNAATGIVGSFSSCSGSAVMARPSASNDSLGQSPAGSARNMRPKRPSNSTERGAELSPRTPPPCPDDAFFLALIAALIIRSSNPEKWFSHARRLECAWRDDNHPGDGSQRYVDAGERGGDRRH